MLWGAWQRWCSQDSGAALFRFGNLCLPLGLCLTRVSLFSVESFMVIITRTKEVPMNSSLVTVLFLYFQLMTLKCLWHFKETLYAAVLNPVQETVAT